MKFDTENDLQNHQKKFCINSNYAKVESLDNIYQTNKLAQRNQDSDEVRQKMNAIEMDFKQKNKNTSFVTKNNDNLFANNNDYENNKSNFQRVGNSLVNNMQMNLKNQMENIEKLKEDRLKNNLKYEDEFLSELIGMKAQMDNNYQLDIQRIKKAMIEIEKQSKIQKDRAINIYGDNLHRVKEFLREREQLRISEFVLIKDFEEFQLNRIKKLDRMGVNKDIHKNNHPSIADLESQEYVKKMKERKKQLDKDRTAIMTGVTKLERPLSGASSKSEYIGDSQLRGGNGSRLNFDDFQQNHSRQGSSRQGQGVNYYQDVRQHEPFNYHDNPASPPNNLQFQNINVDHLYPERNPIKNAGNEVIRPQSQHSQPKSQQQSHQQYNKPYNDNNGYQNNQNYTNNHNNNQNQYQQQQQPQFNQNNQQQPQFNQNNNQYQQQPYQQQPYQQNQMQQQQPINIYIPENINQPQEQPQNLPNQNQQLNTVKRKKDEEEEEDEDDEEEFAPFAIFAQKREYLAQNQIRNPDLSEEERMLAKLQQEEVDQLRILSQIPVGTELYRFKMEQYKEQSAVKNELAKIALEQQLQRVKQGYEIERKDQDRKSENEKWIDDQRKFVIQQQIRKGDDPQF